MKITIDIEELKRLNLTANQYIFLNSIFLDVESAYITSEELNFLEKEGYIKCNEENRVILREKGKQLFEVKTSDSLFFEFFSSYPIKVPNGTGGYRVLRTKDTDTKQALELKRKYLDIVKKPGEHEKIMRTLPVYVKNAHPYLVGIEVFLNQRTWEKYADLEVDEVKKGTENKTRL